MVIAAGILLVGGFLLGFVPQFRSASVLRDQLRGRDERIVRLEREARLSRARDFSEPAVPGADSQELRDRCPACYRLL